MVTAKALQQQLHTQQVFLCWLAVAQSSNDTGSEKFVGGNSSTDSAGCMLLHICCCTLLSLCFSAVSPVFLPLPPPKHTHVFHQVSVSECGVDVGAGVTLSSLEEALKQQVKQQQPYKTRGFAAAVEQLRWFAGEHLIVPACIPRRFRV